MNRLIYFFALFFIISQPLFAQESGVPRAVDVSSRQTTLTLDFSTHDYELILYSFKMDEPDYNRTFNFVVTGNFGASKPPVFHANRPAHRALLTERDRLEYQLRQSDCEIARRLQQTGGYQPVAAKAAVQQQIGSTRQYAALVKPKRIPPSRRPLSRPVRVPMDISTYLIQAHCTPRVFRHTSTTLAQRLIPSPQPSLARNPM